jgi:hypothetical protein
MARTYSCRPSQLLDVDDPTLAFWLDEALFFKLKRAEADSEGDGWRVAEDGRVTTLGIPDEGPFSAEPPPEDILRQIPVEALA